MQEISYQPSSMSPQTVMLTKALWHERQVHVQLMCPSYKIHMEKRVGQIAVFSRLERIGV